MKKSWLVFLSLLLLITALPGMASASESTPGGKVYSEEELDQILIRAGYPDVENLNLADKQFFVENSGEDLRFLE
ncbi:hypothetical protein P4H39_32085, partial [Paenibacillus lautus]|uniref:hypothetical protein n=1 Tax=Paenibacillus lautus TaxID=1401 RepID=UPI002DB90BAF